MKNDTDFFSRVHAVVRQIPEGRLTSYGAIARYLSVPGAARLVGIALNRSDSRTLNLPAHRVVNRNGLLTGKHAFGLENEMARRLEDEGVSVKQNKVVDFKLLFWDPVLHLPEINIFG